MINRQRVQYKGDELDAERGPGLGCFRFQLVVLVVFVILTPLTVAWGWPTWVSAALLFAVIILLLVAGQTIIFLLRLVAADRRSRRRPLASGTKTVGELEDERTATDSTASAATDAATDATNATDGTDVPDAATDSATADAANASDSAPPSDEGPVAQ